MPTKGYLESFFIQDLNKVKDILQKLFKSMAVGAQSQAFEFSRQNTWFLENSKVLCKFLMGFCIT